MNSYTITEIEHGKKLITVLDGRTTIHSAVEKLKEDLFDLAGTSIVIDAIFINGMGKRRFIDIDGNVIDVDDKIRRKADGVINMDTREKFENLMRNKK